MNPPPHPQAPKPSNRIFQIGIGIDFDNLRAHCEFVLSSLDEEEKRFERATAKATEGMDEEQRSAYYEWHEQDAWHVYDVFPSLQWMSSFLLAYGIFEKTLNEICLIAKPPAPSGVSLHDIAGQGIERAKIYLRKVCGISAPFDTPEWQRVVDLSKIRNVLAHKSGDLDLDKKMHSEALKIARKDGAMKVTRYDEFLQVASIEVTGEFVVGAIETFRSFLIAVCNSHAG